MHHHPLSHNIEISRGYDERGKIRLLISSDKDVHAEACMKAHRMHTRTVRTYGLPMTVKLALLVRYRMQQRE